MSLKTIIRQTNKNRADKIPAGFKTARRWAEEEGLSAPQTRKLLCDLVTAKPPKIERKDFMIEMNGILHKTPHYRELK